MSARAFGLLSLMIFLPTLVLSQEATTITVTDSVLLQEVKRFGINVGARNRWGAAQILNNLIDNPGFEAGVMGMVALADQGSTDNTFRQAFWHTSMGAQPEGFWNGADYEIVWGSAKGRQGKVDLFRHVNGSYIFGLSKSGSVPEEGDVMFVRTEIPGIDGNTTIADPNQARPGSPGVQSLRLSSDGTGQWNFYMDSFWRDGDTSVGKMLPVKGGWRVAVWAKGANGGEQARVQFFREGEANFLDETVTLTSEWQQFAWEFNVADGADPVGQYGPEDYRPILGFRLQAVDGSVWFDDVELARTDQTNPTVFTDLFVQRLKELRPGIVRNWSNQLGNSLDNQLVSAWARKTNGYKPRGTAGSYAFSLHEFLELSKEVGAEPWYVLPPTFSPEDLQNIVEYLSAPANQNYPYAMRRAELGQSEPWTTVFRQVHLEFGNELWGSAEPNDPFQGASLRGGVRLGAVASDRFAIIRSNQFFDAEKYNLIIGGQSGYPGRQQEIESNATEHNSVALAPYFGILNTWGSDQELFLPLFAGPFYQAGQNGGVRESYEYLQKGGNATALGIYEINFHTTSGNAPIDVRNDFLTGAAGAVALPLAMLTYQRDFGAVNQAAFSSLGYSFRMGNGEYARVWGMLRDLYATGRKRPTWLGVELANKAISDQLNGWEQVQALSVDIAGANPVWRQNAINGIGSAVDVPVVQAFAFRTPHFGNEAEYGMVVFNLDIENEQVVLLKGNDEFHEIDYGLPNLFQHFQIAPDNIHADNETGEQVVIDTVDVAEYVNMTIGHSVALPPNSIHVFRWRIRLGDGVEENASADNGIVLNPRNPLRSTDPIQFHIGSSGAVRLELVDVAGRTIHVLTDREMVAGYHAIPLRVAKDDPIAPGLYLLRLQLSGETVVRKVVIY